MYLTSEWQQAVEYYLLPSVNGIGQLGGPSAVIEFFFQFRSYSRRKLHSPSWLLRFRTRDIFRVSGSTAPDWSHSSQSYYDE